MDPVAPSNPTGELNIQDLELMMQWCTTTYRSVSRNTSVEGIWQGVVPREAMRHPFLMHGILALSALDLGFNCPSGPPKDYYIRTAQAHQSRAVTGLGKVAGCLDQSNCNAAFALSSIMVVFSFALPRTTNKHGDVLNELLNIFRFTRGSVDVQGGIIDWVADGEFSPLLECDTSQPTMPDTSRLAIMSLTRMNADLASRDPAHDKATYDTTIRYLSYSLDKLARGGETMIIAFQWIFQIPPRYLDLLQQRQPFALTRFMDEIYKYLFFHSPGHDLQFRHRQWMHPHAGEYRVVNMTTLERRVQRARCPSIALNPRETLLPSVGPGSNLTGLPGTHAIVNKRELCSGLQQKEDQDMTGNHIWGGRPGISTKSGAE
ncbi:uncharacterized protein An01g06330 [Aspergillus niger]|uniref:Contig An01c0240, genomic contig n=2 Tax=Aspergillus niger TaxID=5061 RepID=A2Q918_ASPNC|nr:uncharacterized protein An01g06330 [Aspergillus niger]CAK43752.1 unnamed protein product [Aspergillus niger]